jgi:hypothetical protein
MVTTNEVVIGVSWRLTAILSLGTVVFVNKGKSTELILVDAANDVIGNGSQNWFLASKFCVKIDCITGAPLQNKIAN